MARNAGTVIFVCGDPAVPAGLRAARVGDTTQDLGADGFTAVTLRSKTRLWSQKLLSRPSGEQLIDPGFNAVDVVRCARPTVATALLHHVRHLSRAQMPAFVTALVGGGEDGRSYGNG
jgi:hypothetical protein